LTSFDSSYLANTTRARATCNCRNEYLARQFFLLQSWSENGDAKAAVAARHADRTCLQAGGQSGPPRNINDRSRPPFPFMRRPSGSIASGPNSSCSALNRKRMALRRVEMSHAKLASRRRTIANAPARTCVSAPTNAFASVSNPQRVLRRPGHAAAK